MRDTEELGNETGSAGARPWSWEAQGSRRRISLDTKITPFYREGN